MIFKAVEREHMEFIREWRNNPSQRMILRTPYLLTKEMQEEFYEKVISNRNSNNRYWSVHEPRGKQIVKDALVGLAGLENIQWDNRTAEISIITDPTMATRETIQTIISRLLEQAFNNMNLKSVFTEVYGCSPYREIWEEYAETLGAFRSEIPFRKFYEGQYYNGIIHTFARPEVANEDTSVKSPSSLN